MVVWFRCLADTRILLSRKKYIRTVLINQWKALETREKSIDEVTEYDMPRPYLHVESFRFDSIEKATAHTDDDQKFK